MRIDRREGSGQYTCSRDFRVIIDGLEVTTQCFMADDEAGEVGIYLKNDEGAFYREPGTDLDANTAQEIRHGRVVIFLASSQRRRRTEPSSLEETLIA